MKRVKRHFTLIEMLAVVAIAGILIALIIPAVQGLLFGKRVENCASNLKLAMEQAQSKAVSSRKYIALVLPGSQNVSAERLKRFVNCGSRMAVVRKEGDEFHFVNWVSGSEWSNFGDGAMIVNITTKKEDAGKTPAAPEFNGKFECLSTIKSIPSGDHDYAAVGGEHSALVFSPYGGLGDSDQTFYFVITEAKAEGGAYTLPNVDNFMVLKLNAVTGRISFFDPYAENN